MALAKATKRNLFDGAAMNRRSKATSGYGAAMNRRCGATSGSWFDGDGKSFRILIAHPIRHSELDRKRANSVKHVRIFFFAALRDCAARVRTITYVPDIGNGRARGAERIKANPLPRAHDERSTRLNTGIEERLSHDDLFLRRVFLAGRHDSAQHDCVLARRLIRVLDTGAAKLLLTIRDVTERPLETRNLFIRGNVRFRGVELDVQRRDTSRRLAIDDECNGGWQSLHRDLLTHHLRLRILCNEREC